MRLVLLAIVSAVLIATPGTSADKAKDKPRPDLPKVNPLMAEKLKNSQSLLEALAMEDFVRMQKNAEELLRISKAAEWTVYKTPMYEVQTNNFRRAAETLIAKAKAKNLDGVTLAYVDMTVTCVRCHQHCRDIRDTSFIPGRTEE